MRRIRPVSSSRKAFVPRDRFVLSARRDGDAAQSIRPMAYLLDCRLSGDRAPTSRDQMLFELLVTAFVQSDHFTANSVSVPDIVDHMPSGSRQRDLLPCLRRLASTTMDLDGPSSIQPLRSFSISNGQVHCTLDPTLRKMLARSKGEKYAYLDLDRARTFGSGFTLPIYRHLVALHGSNPFPRTVVRQIAFEEVARLVGFRPQKTGGFRGQLDRVMNSVQRDLDRDQTDLTITLRWKGDDGRFVDAIEITTTSPLPDLRRLRSRALDKSEDHDHELQAVVRSDAAPFAVSMSAWTKISGLLRLREPQPVLERLSEALDLAIDEVVRLDEPGFAPLRTTEAGFATSPVRGARLRELIEREGIDRAAVLFAIHELREPDLTTDLARGVAIRTRLIRRVEESRMDRHARSRGWDRRPSGAIEPWISDEELEAYIAERLQSQEDARRRQEEEVERRLAAKLARMERSREGRNERRRKQRAAARGQLMPLEELRPRDRRRREREWAEREDQGVPDVEFDPSILHPQDEFVVEEDVVELAFDDGPSEEEIERMPPAPPSDHSKIPF